MAGHPFCLRRRLIQTVPGAILCSRTGITRKAVPMRKADLLPHALSLVAILAGAATAAPALPLTPFRTQDQAQRHCPGDTVVWLDFNKGKYYAKGQKLYGRGLNGSYVCREEARSSFYRGALIGSR